MVNKVRTLDFLPEIFKTENNREFLRASLDVLTSQPDFRRVEGFIGEKYGYSIEPDDRYVVEPSKTRADYQLDPGVVFLKPETQTAQDFINYPGIINSLRNNNGNVQRHDRLFENQFYSWDPFIDYDKIVNYTQYYWIPTGPAPVPVTTNIVYLSDDYNVDGQTNGYTFTQLPDQVNPTLTLLRGGTYDWFIPAGSADFWIQKVPGVNVSTANRTVSGVTNNGTDNGTVTWVVPNKATLNEDVLYYQSGSDPLSVGVIKLIESNAVNTLDVNDILGKKNYTSPNGVKFTNGLKVTFPGAVEPASYSLGDYYVEGVGSSIVLLPAKLYLAIENRDNAIYNPWSINPWDSDTWDIQSAIPLNPDYITINRNSHDLNAWTRSNRWFHQDVINETIKQLGYAVLPSGTQPVRAQRPIIEYRGNLKLYNSGTLGLGPIRLVDTVTTDAFSTIEGQQPSTVGAIDGLLLSAGTLIIFTADTNPLVRKNVYQVQLLPLGPLGVDIISLVPYADMSVLDNVQVFALEGATYIGTSWRFSTLGNVWYQAQNKTGINQYPLYDVFDANSESFSNIAAYPGTTFTGTKLFSYTPGTGADDPVLGFPISYSNPSTIGDILFTVNFNTETFDWGAGSVKNTVNVNSGFIRDYLTREVFEELTGWVTAKGPSFQYQVFEFPMNTEFRDSYRCDVPAKTDTPWRNVVVYLNDDVLDPNLYTFAINNQDDSTMVYVDSAPGTKVTILIISDVASATAYYQTPSNLENNPFNENITSVAVGDLKNQYRTIFTNAPDIQGLMFGNNNFHDLGNLNRYGLAIIQNSASLVLPGLFLRKPQANFFQALKFNSDSYEIYKQLLIDLAYSGNYNIYQTPSDVLDDIVFRISSTRTTSDAFFWSDMLFSGNPDKISTYNFATTTSTATFTLNRIYDFSQANYYGLGIYITIAMTGITKQLIAGVDYVVSSTAPSVQVNYNIGTGDIITIKEYNQTYGSYCPNTPTKLGLYPAFKPQVRQDLTNGPNYWVIQGHDGSYSRLFGPYNPITGKLTDFRDIALLEFETRVYNNLKVTGAIPLTLPDVIPGQFRQTDYTYQEILDIYSVGFLNWVGANRLDYKSQMYVVGNSYTYNYNQSENKLSNTALLQGYWRGIYRYFYDTDNPALAPWEMLGFTDQPAWWNTRYGPAPYTSGNTYMWEEIAAGYIWNDGAPYVDPRRIRPGLLDVLPTNSLGETISPFDSVMGNYNNLTFQRDWRVGDGAPVESAYLTSSTWCFDLIKIFALTKPAKFFNLFADRDLYKYNAEFDQYLYNNRYHLDPRSLQVYGSGTAKNSYINWIVDYNNQRGANGQQEVSTLLANLDVRLVYSLAGFSAKNYLKFLIEKTTPSSLTTSLLVPDENYAVLLYDNPAQYTVTFSNVVVQKVENGYTISGLSKEKQYFTTVTPEPGPTDKLSAGSVSVQVSKRYNPEKLIQVPYGTLFYSMQTVCEFLINYGRYLAEQGVQYTNLVNGIEQNWITSAQEFLGWAQQNWQINSIISLNPCAQFFEINKPGFVVQPLTVGSQNFLLNQNLVPIQSQNICIYRNNESFSVKILSDGDTVAYTNLNLNSIEHAIVFDNTTAFSDTIYNLVTGLRQPRLLMKGYKTGDWQGYVNTSGFIINENNVRDWQKNVKYPKNIIVTYKGTYWTARKLIEPSEEFSLEDWLQTDYDQVKTGLLPNPSTVAYESLFYYDSNRANLENDVDLLSFSLIGFRPRDYLTNADLSDITQINVYKNIVKAKGTKLLAESFRTANFTKGPIDYVINEIWSIKRGDFGAVLNNNYVECALNSSELISNPSTLGFSNSNTPVDNVQQSVNINTQLINFERKPLTANFLPLYTQGYTTEIGLPSAGYVNLDDVYLSVYDFASLNDNVSNVNGLNANDYVWLANYKGSWNVYQAISINTTLILIKNNQNGTTTLKFTGFHNLDKNDLIAVIDDASSVRGFYTVNTVLNLNEIIINAAIAVNQIATLGFVLKLETRRFDQASDINYSTVTNTPWIARKAWIDADQDNFWAVYQSSPVFRNKFTNFFLDTMGLSTAYTSEIGTLAVNGLGSLAIVSNTGVLTIQAGSGNGTGTQVVAWGTKVWVSDPAGGRVLYYQAISSNPVNTVQITIANTGAIAASRDGQWLFVADSTAQTVYVYMWNASTYTLVNSYTDGSVPASSGWGSSIACSEDGAKFIVGAPQETILGKSGAGAAYVYSRRVQNYYANGVANTFVLADGLPIGNYASVYINDVLQTTGYNITGGNSVSFTTTPLRGSIIEVSTAYIDRVQRFQSIDPQVNANFGFSVDTNRYGAELVVGAPFEINTVNHINGVEGAVYRFTSSGQKYGYVSGNIASTVTGNIFIDGYLVTLTSADINDFITSVNSVSANVVATKVGTTGFALTVKPGTPEVLNNIIDLTGAINIIITDLEVVPYAGTQTIYNLDLTNIGQFGYAVRLSNRDSLAISAPTQMVKLPTTFDVSDNCDQTTTVFDNNATTWVDTFANQGVIYDYTYLPANNESITNPGKYVFGQYITNTTINTTTPEPKFGYSLYYNQGVVVTGSPTLSATGGGVASFTTDWTPALDCEIVKSTSWYVDKKPLPMVDINSLNTINIYDRVTNNTLEFLDYIDPAQGKILGAVRTNLDFMSAADPACYNDTSLRWTWDFVGKTWLNLNTIRMLDTHQPDINYNASNWSRAFPGSTAEVYTWIESDVTPLDYTGSGFPVNFENYTSATTLDKATNSLKTYYYFWVKNFDMVPPGKNLSPIVISGYLLNAKDSGISFLAPLTTNIVAMYNCSSAILANTAALHLGYGLANVRDNKHENWQLIRADNAQDFLPGLPSVANTEPSDLYLKFIQSFTGFDAQGNPVPSPYLPLQAQSGTSFRPVQSMYYNKSLALKNYLLYANELLIQYPIVETRDLSYLEYSDEFFNLPQYWHYVNWWATGYSDNTKPVTEVTDLNDLLPLGLGDNLTGTSGVTITIENGTVVKITANSLGKSEYYVYEQLTGWVRIGLQDGTIQFDDSLWTNTVGWDSDLWGDNWDYILNKEIFWVVRWLNEKCYISDLEIERNRSLILMFKFIQSETIENNNYLPWLNKTSLVDVKHKIRDLLPYKKFQRDNQEFLEGFLNEIKPYHVFIKDFVYNYTGEDVFAGDITDFDLPAEYEKETGKFVSPQLTYIKTDPNYNYDSPVWQKPEYNQWFTNLGLHVSSIATPVALVAQTTQSMTISSSSVMLTSVTGLPANGTVLIGSELVAYNSIDYATNKILGLTRGYNGTVIATHVAGTPVNVELPSIMLISTGRLYTEPPRVSAYIDTAVYPEPRRAAVLEPVMSLDKVIGVTVIDPGEGYVVQPEIVIDSSMSIAFSSANINMLTYAITIPAHGLLDDDIIRYTTGVGSVKPAGLVENAYYYVRKIDVNTVVLYESARQASVANTQTAAYDGRVKFITPGSGTNLLLNLTARAVCFTNSEPIRELSTRMKFDRISYESDVTAWIASTAYTVGDLVTYNSRLYECLIANNDATFQTPNLGVTLFNIATITRISNVVTVVTQTAHNLVTGNYVTVTGVPGFNGQFGSITVVNSTTFTYAQTAANQSAAIGKVNRAEKWAIVLSDDPRLNAANRIAGYYLPTLSMPGNALNLVMSGTENPAPIILSYSFTDTSAVLDAVVASPDFNDLTSSLIFQGGEFLEGYAPEELVGSAVFDLLNLTVTSDYSGTPLNFRIAVDRYGNQSTYNVNPVTQTALSTTFINTGSSMDTISVNDATKLVDVGQTSGVLLLNNEFIGFNSVNLLSDTVSYLVRGMYGSITNQGNISAGTIVQSQTASKLLPIVYTDQWWYGAPSSPGANTTLLANTYPAAVFLQSLI